MDFRLPARFAKPRRPPPVAGRRFSRIKPQSGIIKLRGICRMIIIFSKHCQETLIRYKHMSDTLFIPLIDTFELEMVRPLFDSTPFRCVEKEWISDKAKDILKMQPRLRTNALIRYVYIEARRIIVHEGTPGRAVYLILSGTGVVKSEPNGTLKTLVFLGRGVEFGELAIITGEPRSASVLSKTTVELLSIAADDFERIFMSGGRKSLLVNGDNTTFLRRISFLQRWPIEKLALNPHMCFFHHFAKGQVVCDDSTDSKWIYVIREGCAHVLTRVTVTLEQSTSPDEKQARARAMATMADAAQPLTPSRKSEFFHWISRMNAADRGKLESGFVTVPNTAVAASLHDTLPGIFDKHERLGLVNYDLYLTNRKKQLRAKIRQLGRVRALVGSHIAQVKQDKERQEESSFEIARKSIQDGAMFPKRDDIVANSNLLEKEKQQSHELKEIRHKMETIQSHGGRKTIFDRLKGMDSGPAILRPVPVDGAGSKAVRHGAMLRTGGNCNAAVESSGHDFLQIRRLYKGDHFGLSEVLFPDQPKMSLVSQGSDCILISKQLFLQYSSEVELDKLRLTEDRYPSSQQISRMYHNQQHWLKFRRKVYDETLRLLKVPKL